MLLFFRGLCNRIPRDSLRHKFPPQIKRRLFGFAAFLPDLRRFFRIAAELVFSFFYPPFGRKSAGMRRKSAGMRRKFPGKQTVLRRFCFGCGVFLFAADFLECDGNFRRNALRQKFPPQEVLGMLCSTIWASYVQRISATSSIGSFLQIRHNR